MSEIFLNHEHSTIVSRARDILLHCGRTSYNPDTGGSYVLSEPWDGADSNDDVWQASLIGSDYYSSSWYCVDLRSYTTSAMHRYQYNVAKDLFTHESPLGEVVPGQAQEVIATSMRGWLAIRQTPDAIAYDSEGKEMQQQRMFDEIGARIAIMEVAETPEGQKVLKQLVSTLDSEEATKLYQSFYDLSRRDQCSFSIGQTATRTALESIVNKMRPRQLSPGFIESE